VANRQEVVDDHQSPVKPAEYLQLRILPLLNFYKKRLPLYYRIRTYIEFLLILGGLGTTILAFLQYWWYAPIVAVCAAATTAWLEFSDTSKKLARYSDVVHQVDNIVYWWKSLTDVDRASLANIEQVCVSGCSVRDSTLCLHVRHSAAPLQLILRSEELFATERQAWLSTSMVAKTLSKHVENGAKAGDAFSKV